jgi:hypothetical protein
MRYCSKAERDASGVGVESAYALMGERAKRDVTMATIDALVLHSFLMASL